MIILYNDSITMSYKDKAKRKIKSISLGVLEIIEDLVDVSDAFIFSGRSTSLFKQKLWENRISDNRIFDRLNYLKDTGYIKYSRNNNSLSVKLTLKGKIKLLENSAERKTDGKWRMISFDIPEDIKARREQFRRAIKRIGFRQVQKSLWACPFAKADAVVKAIKYYKVDKYVAYLVIEKSDIDNYLKKLFKDDLRKKRKS